MLYELVLQLADEIIRVGAIESVNSIPVDSRCLPGDVVGLTEFEESAWSECNWVIPATQELKST